MEKLTLTKVTSLTKDKLGNPLKTRDGRPYTRLLINCNEYGDSALSGFANEQTEQWRVGDKVDVMVEKVTKDGKNYLNFSLPKVKKLDSSEIMVELGFISRDFKKMNDKIDRIILHLSGEDRLDRTSDGSPVPNFDLKRSLNIGE